MNKPTTLDEAIQLFADYVREKNDFDELDFKEYLIDTYMSQIIIDTRIEVVQGWLDWLEQGGSANKTEFRETLIALKEKL